MPTTTSQGTPAGRCNQRAALPPHHRDRSRDHVNIGDLWRFDCDQDPGHRKRRSLRCHVSSTLRLPRRAFSTPPPIRLRFNGGPNRIGHANIGANISGFQNVVRTRDPASTTTARCTGTGEPAIPSSGAGLPHRGTGHLGMFNGRVLPRPGDRDVDVQLSAWETRSAIQRRLSNVSDSNSRLGEHRSKANFAAANLGSFNAKALRSTSFIQQCLANLHYNTGLWQPGQLTFGFGTAKTKPGFRYRQ